MTTNPIITIDDIAEIARGGVSETPNFLSPDIILALREDVIALLRAGAFVRGRLRLAAPACACLRPPLPIAVVVVGAAAAAEAAARTASKTT